MSKTTDNDIFQSIKSALKQDKPAGGYTEILKMEPGNTYTVRLLPAKDPSKTFFAHSQHGWVSRSTGTYISALSLQTFGEKDPISEECFKVKKNGTAEEKEKISIIKWSKKWLVNAYIVNDPKTPENNGKNKIIRYGKQIQNIIQSAIDGDDAEDLGARIFDLSETGVNLKIKVELVGDFPTYVSSKFSLPVALPGVDAEKAQKIKDSVYDLTAIFPAKSAAELKTMLNEHYHCVVDGTPETPENVPEDKPEKKVEKKKAPVSSGDKEVDDLLEGLNS